MPSEPDKPSYYDNANYISAYVMDDKFAGGDIAISLPSDVWVTAAEARAFGEALVRMAAYVEANPVPEAKP